MIHEMVTLSGMRLTYWETGLPSWLRADSCAPDPLSSSRAGHYSYDVFPLPVIYSVHVVAFPLPVTMCHVELKCLTFILVTCMLLFKMFL